MTSRSDYLTLPSLRWIAPVAGMALLATLLEALRRRARRPVVRPMSDEWLREHIASGPDEV